MNVLVACEESQRVCTAFRERGHNAFSCDIQPCSGGHPEWHIQGNVLWVLNPDAYRKGVSRYGIRFITANGEEHQIMGKWDLIIAHPPCTYLTLAANRWFNIEKYGDKALERYEKRESAADFFMNFVNAICEKVAIENPIGVMSTLYRKPDQIIHPWMISTTEEEKTEKATCLWLKGLPPLVPKIKEKPELKYHEWIDSKGRNKRQTIWYYQTRCLPHSERGKEASKTFPGIARAMAEQWG